MRTRTLQYAMAAAILFALTPAVASAQTMSFAEAADKLVTACGKDLDKFCKGVNLGGGKLKNCLRKNQASVSAGCKTAGAQIFAGIDKRATARMTVIKACDADIRRFCGDVARGDGQILECMLTSARGVSSGCNQAITDAGYR